MTGSWYPDKFCMCLLVDVSFSACDEAVISYQMIRTRRCNMEGRHLNTQIQKKAPRSTQSFSDTGRYSSYFSASRVPDTRRYSVIVSLKYSRYWQVFSRFHLGLFQVLVGTHSFSISALCTPCTGRHSVFSYSRYWQVLRLFQL